MLKLLHSLFVLIAITFVQACSFTHVAVIDNKQPATHYLFTLNDKRLPEIRGSFMTKMGNIYSCHYGIKRLENNEIVPERLLYIADVLNNRASRLLHGKTLTVTRFTIFQNNHIELRNSAVAGNSGGIAAATVMTGSLLPAAITLGSEALLLNDGELIGCKENYTGAYWSSELSGGHTPIVLYFEGTLDEKPLSIRIVQPAGEHTAYVDQIHTSLDVLANEIIKLANQQMDNKISTTQIPANETRRGN